MEISSNKSLPPGIRDPARRYLVNPILGEEIFFEKYGAETNGTVCIVTTKVRPGGGTPAHYHATYNEYFHALDGDLSVLVGDEVKTLSPGESVEVLMGTKHRFFNAYKDRPVTFRGECKPACVGFERFLYIVHGLAQDGYCDEEGKPKNLMQVCLLLDMADMSFPGWGFSMAWPALKAMAAYARWSGEEERLLKKYWY